MRVDAMKTSALIIVTALILPATCLAAPPPCEADALAQAQRLLAFHSNNDDRAGVASHAKVLPSVTNPANRKQQFLVLEVMGDIYKSNYRMRFLYYPEGGECLLMGQEILELSNP